MNLRLALGVVLSGALLLSCEDGGSSTNSSGGGTLSGSYRSAEAVKGMYQTLTFGPGNQVAYVREADCVDERDSGTAELKTFDGVLALDIELDRGWGKDYNYSGTGCAPLVKLNQDDISFFGPTVFRWVSGRRILKSKPCKGVGCGSTRSEGKLTVRSGLNALM